MVAASSLSVAANELRSLLHQEIDGLVADQVKIGHPKDTFESMQSDLDYLNLFFYNVQYDGYPADATSEDPIFVRVHCLITSIGATTASISAGENDLRLIGESMRVLHEQPFLLVTNESDEPVAQLSVVPHPLNLDNLNHIWSTQGDTAYRLSIAYELSLAPVPLETVQDRSPKTGEPNMLSWGSMNRPSEDEKFGLIKLKPTVSYLEIDDSIDDWSPHICFNQTDVDTGEDLHYVYTIDGSLASELDILVAGKEDGSIQFVWNVWRRKTDGSVEPWLENIADQIAPLSKVLDNDPPSVDPFYANRIDPDNIDARQVHQVRLPDIVTDSETQTWQATLYAIHERTFESPEGSGNFVTNTNKSNLILFAGEGE